MKKLMILLLAVLLAGCEQTNPEETTVSTTEPTTQATTAPTTATTTAPTTAPTEPEPTILEPELWLTDPQYPSYEELFSQDVSYADYTTDWIVEHEGIYREYHFEAWNDSVQVYSYYSDLVYPVPNTESFMDDYDAPQYFGSDGKYAYFYNRVDTNRIFQMELLTGKVVTLIDEEKIYAHPMLQANCVVYYARAAGDKAEICRIYIPEQRVDVLCTVENTEYLFDITYPATTGGKISWYGLNPEIVAKAEALRADPNAGKIINEYDYTGAWGEFASGLKGMHQDFREMFFYHFKGKSAFWPWRERPLILQPELTARNWVHWITVGWGPDSLTIILIRYTKNWMFRKRLWARGRTCLDCIFKERYLLHQVEMCTQQATVFRGRKSANCSCVKTMAILPYF